MDNTFVKIGSGQDMGSIIKSIQTSDTVLFLFFYGAETDVQHIFQTMLKTGKNFLGCMHAGSFANDQYFLEDDSIVACSFSEKLFDAMAFGKIDMHQANNYEGIREESREELIKAADQINVNLSHPDMRREFAINLLFGLQSATPFLEGQSLAGMMLQTVGGSSGGKLDFKNTSVMSHQGLGSLGTFGLFRLKESFSFSMDRVSCFNPLPGKELKVTKIAAPRHILEFNGQPAAEEYCRQLGLDENELSPDVFARYTLGIDPGDDERLITSIMDTDENRKGFLTYNDVLPGTVFNLYESIDQTADRRKVYQQLNSKAPIAFISFDCILCYLARSTVESMNSLCQVYASSMNGVPKIGFGTFSENITGANINQTETFLAIYKN